MKLRKTFVVIIAFLFMVGLCFSFSACSSVQEFEEKESPVEGLVCISMQENFIDNYVYDQYILYDPDTLVMYSMIGYGEGICMTVLYNADGTLKLYNENK